MDAITAPDVQAAQERARSGDRSEPLAQDTDLGDLPSPLARDVRLLGDTLDQVLSEAGGSDLLNDVLRLRRATMALRTTDAADDAARVSRLVDSYDLGRAEAVARAFTVYFQLVNLAEERHRVRTLRARRRGRDAIADSVASAVDQIVAAHGRERLLDVVGRLRVHPVLTAHPTEARRRAVSDALQRVMSHLERLDDPNLTRVDESTVGRRLLEEVAILWRTNQLRSARPSPVDEVRRVLAVFDETIFRVLPIVLREVDRALGPETVGTRPPLTPGFISWGSWVGGDRDGNPNVTSQVTREAVEIHADHTLRGLENAARRIGRTLSASADSTPASMDLERSLETDAAAMPETSERLVGTESEPHRRKMGFVAYRLRATRHGEAEGYDGSAALVADLDVVQRSLDEAGAPRLAYGELQHLRWQAETFGFHFASLEIRQASTVHAEILEELRPGVSSDVAALDRLASDGWDELPERGELSDAAREMFDTFRVVAELQERYGVTSCRRWCVSWSRTAADVLAVRALARAALPERDLTLDVVPLFESRADLERAPEVLDELLSLPGERARVDADGRRMEIMLGYSDSAKDAGFLAANVGLYEAQARLSWWARRHDVELTLFHGRGGAMGRGGGPTNRAIQGQAPGSVDGRFKVTEQGEIVFARYANVPLAERHLEQVTNAVLQASVVDIPEGDPTWPEGVDEDLVRTMVAASERKYRRLVESDGFAEFFSQVTPSNEIAALQIGSRPAKRHASGGLESLRAIPWVFAWTQNRVNLPGWYGLGTGLATAAEQAGGVEPLRRLAQSWPFMATLLDNAEMSLVKADPLIAERYLALSQRDDLAADLRTEMELTQRMLLEVTRRERLLEHRQVLRRAVDLRNPYVDALSFLQVRFLSELRAGGATDERTAARLRKLVMLTVNGVAAGLQNTG